MKPPDPVSSKEEGNHTLGMKNESIVQQPQHAVQRKVTRKCTLIAGSGKSGCGYMVPIISMAMPSKGFVVKQNSYKKNI